MSRMSNIDIEAQEAVKTLIKTGDDTEWRNLINQYPTVLNDNDLDRYWDIIVEVIK